MLSPGTMKAVRRSGAVPGAEFLLDVRGVSKTFPGVVALDNVQLQVRPGSVHALMGENGAGKSTLMKIIAGIYTPEGGSFKLRGVDIRLTSPLDALENGIAMIHQELNLMAPMTVAENIWIRREPLNRFGLIDHRAMHRQTQEQFERLGIDLDPDGEVSALSVANRQMVEIAKAVSYESDVLIMDEPTSALTDREVDHLFRIIRSLKAEGKGIVYITHKMNELFEIADEVSVFRDGHYIGTHASGEVTRDDIIHMMVGREITQMFPKETVAIGDIILSVKGLGLKGVFHDVSFDLRRGEILGIAGLVGSGRSNIAETLFGVTPATSGEIRVDGKPTSIDSPGRAMDLGFGFLTEDRKETGCFLALQENTQVAVLNRQKFVTAGFVRQGALSKASAALTDMLRVKTPSLAERILNLSGGNQQKVLIARWLLTQPRILILDEPTRGIDVGAKAEIHRLISRLAGDGLAVIMISSELPEVLGMSDRIMVVHEGQMTGILDRKDADQVKAVQPVDSRAPKTELPFPMNIRLSMTVWNFLFLDTHVFAPDPRQSAEWNRGAYLVQGAAHCGTCHTPRGFLMEEEASRALSGAQVGPWYAPNITSNPATGIGDWTREELVAYLRTGRLPGKAQAAGSMGEAVEHSFQHLSAEDLNAIATYVRSVPPIHDPASGSRFAAGRMFSALGALRGRDGINSNNDANPTGAELFQGNCASCHSAEGQGSKDGYYPSLFHNSATGAKNPTNLIAAILYGVDRTALGSQAFMPGFGGHPSDSSQLSDRDIAVLGTYVFTHYGSGDATSITEREVSEARRGGPSSLLLPLARWGIAAATIAIILATVFLVYRRRRLSASP